MHEWLSARTAERAAHSNAVNSTSCDGGRVRLTGMHVGLVYVAFG